MTTLATALSEATARLRDRESARADALLLLEHALGRSRAWIAAHGETPLSPESESEFRALCERRDTGVPVAYLVRSAGFYGREFVVDESVLIPRPETEHLIDDALAFIGGATAAVLDVGTGSGAIACTIAAHTQCASRRDGYLDRGTGGREKRTRRVWKWRIAAGSITAIWPSR